MADERHNPTGSRPMTHAQFEALLADAIDGTLSPGDKEPFNAHAASCELCAPALALAQAGHSLLAALPELEPPAYLLQKILNVTSEVPARAVRKQEAGWTDRL